MLRGALLALLVLGEVVNGQFDVEDYFKSSNCNKLSVKAVEGICKDVVFTARTEKGEDQKWNKAYLPIVFSVINSTTCERSLDGLCELFTYKDASGAEQTAKRREFACVEGGPFCPILASISERVPCSADDGGGGESLVSHSDTCGEGRLCPFDILAKYTTEQTPCCHYLKDAIATVCDGVSANDIGRQLQDQYMGKGQLTMGLKEQFLFGADGSGEPTLSCSTEDKCFKIGSEEVLWGVPTRKFCNKYGIIEKPYMIIFLSTTIFAFVEFALKQVSCKVQQQPQLHQVVPELQEVNKGVVVLSNLATGSYYIYQFALSVWQAIMIMQQVIEDPELGELWSWRRYNLLVYVLIHSSALVTGVSLTASFIKRELTGEGDDESSFKVLKAIGVFILVTGGLASCMIFTHWIPGVILYIWYFLSASVLVYTAWKLTNKAWDYMHQKVSTDDEETLEADLGGFVLQLILVPLLVVVFQTSAAFMVRVYDGQWQSSHLNLEGYMQPVIRDYYSRDTVRWSICTFRQDGETSVTQFIDLVNLIS